MSAPPTAASVPDDGIRHYSFLCMVALGGISLALFLSGLDVWSLVPAISGALALTFRLRNGALAILLIVAWLVVSQRWPVWHPGFIIQEITWVLDDLLISPTWKPVPNVPLRPRVAGFHLVDLLLAAGAFVFCVSYYRFLGVAARIFPADPRRRGKGDADLDRRSPGLVAPREVLILLAGVPFWFALAWLCWRWLGRRQTTLDIDDRWWQLMVVGWLFGLVAVATSALLRYSGQAQMRPEEAKMLLQDIVWRETSREQRSISRWIAWARRRSRRKGDI